MVMTDPIADMLTRLRNGISSRKQEILLPYSKLKKDLAELLKSEGYLKEVKATKGKEKRKLVLVPKYVDGEPVIKHLRRISRPGRRFYLPAKSLKKVLGGYGIAVISTSVGLLTDREARHRHIGGEILLEVY